MAIRSEEIAFWTIDMLHAAITSKALSANEIAVATLDLKRRSDAALNCFVSETPELLLQAAAHVDRLVANEETVLPLVGIPMSVKDNLPVAGVRFTNGSRVLKDNVATTDAVVVERLRRLGAGIVGKTTTSEFGCKPVGDSPLTGVTRNPWDIRKTSGGSSAGAAASVAAGVTPYAIATDGGGSARLPASFCGLFGIKPQFGRIPFAPPPGAPSLVHVSVLSRTVRDSAQVLGSVSGPDVRDAASVGLPRADFVAACDAPVRGLRVAWCPNLGLSEPDQEVRAITEGVARMLEGLGCHVEFVDAVLPADLLEIWANEFMSSAGTRLAPLQDKSGGLLDPMVAHMLTRGRELSVEAYWKAAFRRIEIRERINRLFQQYDVLLTPTVPVTAFDVLQNGPMPGSESIEDVISWLYYLYPFNLTGHPAASVPAGFSATGLPVGVQVVAGTNNEAAIFALAAALEEARPWAHHRPQWSGG